MGRAIRNGEGAVRRRYLLNAALCALVLGLLVPAVGAAEPGYMKDIKPLLRKYCGGCHSESEREGDFSAASYESLMKGTPKHTVIAAGKPEGSRLLQLMRGKEEPRMPPEDEPQPTADEIARIEAWIAAGAKNDADAVPLDEQLSVPMLRADADAANYITSMIDVSDRIVAIARMGRCEWRDSVTQQILFSINDIPGKINQLRLSRDGRTLLISSGIAGVGGQVTLVDVASREVIGKVQGHTDAIYAAALTSDGKLLATGSYDRVAILWDWQRKQIVRRFAGHNGAIYDLDIDPEAKVLATASADQTIKLWGIGDGERLDTLGQPEGEMLCVRFTPDGQHVLASGADRQLRLWRIASKDKAAISPLLISRYAHEEPVTQLVFRGDAEVLSLSEDRTIKLWSLPDLAPIGMLTRTADQPMGIGKLTSGSSQLLVADYAGSIAAVSVPTKDASKVGIGSRSKASDNMPATGTIPATEAALKALDMGSIAETAEREPNDRLDRANVVSLPARIVGAIDASSQPSDSPRDAQTQRMKADVDLYAFDAKENDVWVIEVNAARSASALDSQIDIVDSDGQPVLRTRLQALRETYFTFRGKDSNTSDDFRMHKWQEMELNEMLYAGGEVVKLWLYPRGPDSGFKVYPGYGNRTTLFDTTPTTHALGELAYIVRELKPNETPLPNGLPMFPIYYQNDDDACRRWGKDSHLTFTAPKTGRYYLRIRDARGFEGADFKYRVDIRPQRPDFEFEFKSLDFVMSPGTGREWQVTARRLDGLQAPIEIHLSDVPAGFQVTNPLVIEGGQDIAYGNIFAGSDASLPDGQDKLKLKATAVSRTPQGEIVHELDKPITISLKKSDEVALKLVDAKDPNRELEELEIRPGQTVTARVIVSRNGHKGPIGFGKDDAGRNLPHGSYVDNIGLNGLLITDDATEREFFITAASWLEPQERLFHLRSETKNNPTSRSIKLRVLPK